MGIYENSPDCGIPIEGKNHVSQALLDAIPIILAPLIKAKRSGVDISNSEACETLRRWDEARG